MAQSIRVSLPGYNALTDTDPDHFALYADEDWVLVKEKTSGSRTVPAGQYASISLDSNTSFTFFVYYKDGNIWRSLTGQLQDLDSSTNLPYVIVFGSTLAFYSTDSQSTEFKYFICYDQ